MSNARHTPEVSALVQKHIDERTVMEAAGNWNHSHALRQVKELLALADSLETQRDAALERERVLREALKTMLGVFGEIGIDGRLGPSPAQHTYADDVAAVEQARAALAAKGEK